VTNNTFFDVAYLRVTRRVRVVDTHALDAQKVFAVGDASRKVEGVAH
jgi:hypothetical protein